MISVDEAVSDLIQESIAHIEEHRKLVELLNGLTQLAANTVSPHDMGMALLAELGSEAEVKAFLQRRSDRLNKAFDNWYIAARIAANEGRKPQ